MIKVVAKQTVPEGKQEEYLAIAKELFEKTRKEKGNIFYTLNRSVQDPTSLAVIECWEDQEALSAHMASEHFNRILPALGALCEGEGSIEVFEEIL